MYYLYGKINRGHGICPLYGGCPLLGESAIRGFTVIHEIYTYTTMKDKQDAFHQISISLGTAVIEYSKQTRLN